MANRFVSDPREVVKSGQVVRVKVLEADPERKRISLTLRLDEEPSSGAATARKPGGRPPGSKPNRNAPSQGRASSPQAAPGNTAMAEALRKAGLGK
jgi:uncharacterized protein